MNIELASFSTSDNLTLGIACIAAIVCAFAAAIAACACLDHPAFAYGYRRRYITIPDILLFLVLFLPPGLYCVLLVLLALVQPAVKTVLLSNAWIAPLPPYLFGAFLCAFAAALPWQWLAARIAYRRINPHALESAALLGISRRQIWRSIVKASAGGRVRTGMVMTFAAALGEYAATWLLWSNLLQSGAYLQDMMAKGADSRLNAFLIQLIQSGAYPGIVLIKVQILAGGAAAVAVILLCQHHRRKKGHKS